MSPTRRTARLGATGAAAAVLAATVLTTAAPIDAAQSPRLVVLPSAATATRGADAILVNAGGSSLLSRARVPWGGDRSFVGGRAVTTTRAIRGTSNDALYRDARMGMRSYRLRLPASGTYQVTLLFAEPAPIAPGARVFSVHAEGAVVVRNLDIARRVGVRHALRLSRRVVTAGTTLDLRFDARRGSPIVSGISAKRLVPARGPGDDLVSGTGVASAVAPSLLSPATTTRTAPLVLSAPTADVRGSRTFFRYRVVVPNRTTLRYLMVVVRPTSGADVGKDTGVLLNRRLAGPGSFSAFQTLRGGSWLAAVAYSVDGRSWTVGPGRHFQVGSQRDQTRSGAPPSQLKGPVFDPRDYGARGDGVHDDTAALQAALNAAFSAGGGTVRVGPGTYLISHWLVYFTNTQLIGDSADTVTIRNTTTRTGTTLMLRPNGRDVSNVTIRGITFDQRGDVYDRDGDSKWDPAVDVSNTDDTTVHFSRFRNIRTVGVYADATVAHPSRNLKINDNYVYEAGGDGISVFGRFTNLQINRNTVEHTQDDAIAIQDHISPDEFPSDVEIIGNVVRDCTTRTTYGSTPNGINVWGGDRVLVADNIVTRVFTNGLRLGIGTGRRGTRITARNNVITGAGTNNDTSDVPGNGVFVIGADDVWLTGNTVTDSAHLDYRILDSTRVRGP